MSSNIKEHVQQLDTALSKQKDAWAAWRDAATKARFAASTAVQTRPLQLQWGLTRGAHAHALRGRGCGIEPAQFRRCTRARARA